MSNPDRKFILSWVQGRSLEDAVEHWATFGTLDTAMNAYRMLLKQSDTMTALVSVAIADSD